MKKKLAFPDYSFQLRDEGNKTLVFDELRKRWVILTDEENVRQHLWKYLHIEFNYPKGRIACEKKIIVNNLAKRFDLVVYNKKGNPEMVIECKSPKIKLTNDVLYQASRYNINLKAKYLLITNGLELKCCEINFKNGQVLYLDHLPLIS